MALFLKLSVVNSFLVSFVMTYGPRKLLRVAGDTGYKRANKDTNGRKRKYALYKRPAFQSTGTRTLTPSSLNHICLGPVFPANDYTDLRKNAIRYYHRCRITFAVKHGVIVPASAAGRTEGPMFPL